ncbi:hypothetical protein ACHAXS_012275 [Conticribra weissflogii]
MHSPLGAAKENGELLGSAAGLEGTVLVTDSLGRLIAGPSINPEPEREAVTANPTEAAAAPRKPCVQ